MMALNSRLLPPNEWGKLSGTEAGKFAAQLPAAHAQVLVVEDGDQIVASWVLLTMLHAEGLWVHPAYRGRFGVVKRLLAGMRSLVLSVGATAVQTGAISDEVRGFIRRCGGSPLPGEMFVLPMEGLCRPHS